MMCSYVLFVTLHFGLTDDFHSKTGRKGVLFQENEKHIISLIQFEQTSHLHKVYIHEYCLFALGMKHTSVPTTAAVA